jgi:hypothetical protein
MGRRRESNVGEMSFLLSVFAVLEHLNKSELTNTSKKLIINYLNEASSGGMAQKARAAIWKYTQTVVPSLESIRQKSASQKLDRLDHLVLKMEYEASRLG